MKNKSLSPRLKSAIKSSRIVLTKLSSLKQLPSPTRNESVVSLNPSDSHLNFSNSHLSSQISSSSKLNLKLSQSPQGFLGRSTQNKLKTIASKVPSLQTAKSFNQNIGEHLLPLNSDTVALTFTSVLTPHELLELEGYSYIYYLGLKAKKSLPVVRKNYLDYDDKETDYIVVIGDHIAFQYEIIEILGSGSFAQVCKCWDHKNKREVAIKIIKSHKRFHDQGQVELKVLGYLLKHDKNIGSHFVKMIEYFFFRRHLCIVFELLSFNLYELLKANQFKGFSLTLIRRFALQILNGLSYLKAHEIIHCDLKPENIILINPTESLIKIIDFGSSCFEDEKVYYYIQSRIYRAPEIILGIEYTAAIDMWSLGCIVVELLTGVPLFLGESETDQLFAIMEILGCPSESLLRCASKKKNFFHSDGSPRNFVNSKGKVRVPGSKKLEEKVPANDFGFVDFVKSNWYLGCLEWAPMKRMTPEEGLGHPWIQQMKKIKSSIHKTSRSPRVRIN